MNPSDHIIISKVPLISEILGVLLRVNISQTEGKRSIIRICRDCRFEMYHKKNKYDCYKTFENGIKNFEALKSSLSAVLKSSVFTSASYNTADKKNAIRNDPAVVRHREAFKEHLLNEVRPDLIEIMDFYIYNAENSLLLIRNFIDEEKTSSKYVNKDYIDIMMDYIECLYSIEFDVEGKITKYFQNHLDTLADQAVKESQLMNDTNAVKLIQKYFEECDLVSFLKEIMDNELIKQTKINWGEFIGKQIILSMDILSRIFKYSCDKENGVTVPQLQRILGFDIEATKETTNPIFEFKYSRVNYDENELVEHIILPSKIRSFFEKIKPKLLLQMETKIRFRYTILMSLFILPRPDATSSEPHQLSYWDTSQGESSKCAFVWADFIEAYHNRIERLDSSLKFIWLMALYCVEKKKIYPENTISLLILSIVSNRPYKELNIYRQLNENKLPNDLAVLVGTKDLITDFLVLVFQEYKDLCEQESIFGEKEFVFFSDNSDTFYPVLAQRLVSCFLNNIKQIPGDSLTFHVCNCDITFNKNIYTKFDVLKHILDITGITINNNKHVVLHEHGPHEHELYDIGEILDLIGELHDQSMKTVWDSSVSNLSLPPEIISIPPNNQIAYYILPGVRGMFYRFLTHLICNDETNIKHIIKVAERLYRKNLCDESNSDLDQYIAFVLCSIKIDIRNVQYINIMDTTAVDMHLAVLEFVSTMFRASANGFMELHEPNSIRKFNLMAEFFDLSTIEQWIGALTEQLYVCTFTINDRVKVKVVTKIFELFCELSSSGYCLPLGSNRVPLASFIMSKLFFHHSEHFLPQFLVALKNATYSDTKNAKQKRITTDSKLILSAVQMFYSFVHYIKQDSHLLNNSLMEYLTTANIRLDTFCEKYNIMNKQELSTLLSLTVADDSITYGKILSAIEANYDKKNRPYLSQETDDVLAKLEFIVKENFNGTIGFDFMVEFAKHLIDCTVYILLETNQAKHAYHDNWNIMAACLHILESIASVPSANYSGSSLYISSVLEDYLMSIIASNDQLMHLICTMSTWPTAKAMLNTKNRDVKKRMWNQILTEVVDFNEDYKPKPEYINILPVIHSRGLWFGSDDDDIDEHTIPFVNKVIDHSLSILNTIFHKAVSPVYSREVVTKLQSDVDAGAIIKGERSIISNKLYQILISLTHGTTFDPFNHDSQVYVFQNTDSKFTSFNYIIGLCGMIHINFKGIWVEEIDDIQLKVVTLLTDIILFMGCNSSCTCLFDDIIGVLNIAGFVDAIIHNFSNPEVFRDYKHYLLVNRVLDLLLGNTTNVSTTHSILTRSLT